MRTVPAPIAATIAAQRLTSFALCWKITKRNGDVLYGTEHDRDVTIESGQFAGTYLSEFNISGSDIKLNSDLSVDNMEVAGAIEQVLNVTIRVQDIESGVLDGASLAVILVDWEEPADGQVIVRAGYMGKIFRDSNGMYRSELRGLTQKLTQQIGQNYSENCNVVRFGDERCKFDLSTITQHCIVVEVFNRKQFSAEIQAGSGTLPVTLPRGGEVQWTSGDNDGFSREIKSMTVLPDALYVELYEESAGDIAVGDAVDIIPGCDRQYTTCKGVYDNLVNFRGHGVFVPGLLAMMRGSAVISECGLVPPVATEPPEPPPPFPDPTDVPGDSDDPPDSDGTPLPDFEDEDGETIVWHPGQYAEFQGQSRKDVDQAYRIANYYDSHIAPYPDVLGVSVCYHWADLEPTRRNYQAGVNLILRDLQALASMTPPRRLCVGFRGTGRNLRRDQWTMIYPQWMIDAGWVIEDIRNSFGNTFPSTSWKTSNPQAVQAFHDLWTGLATGLKKSPLYPQIEMVRPYQEAHWRDYVATQSYRVQYWKNLAAHLRATFPTKVIWIPLQGNPVDHEYLGEVMDYFITKDVGVGMSDTLPRGTKGTSTRLQPENRWLVGQEDGLDRRPYMSVCAGVEGSELGQGSLGPSNGIEGYTAREIYDFLNDTIHANYIFWEVTDLGANSQNWFDTGTENPGGVLDIINGETLDHTTKPSNYP